MVNPSRTNTKFIEEREFEIKVVKSQNRVALNLTLLQIVVGVFTFIVAVSPHILEQNLLIAVQLVMCIPLLMSSTFSRQKHAYAKSSHLWSGFGYVTFLLAYSALINVVGILLSLYATIAIALSFFAVCIVLAIAYSVMEVLEIEEKLFFRIAKDALFIILLVVFGVLPVIGVY
ncbi:MAG TPA: hypothetical protein VK158_03850 [Acidobacteriota bacterium]|nr:hypothetical protein [Acidobacteriota bacterium]